mmetsp:Transcript_4438/g.8460  ORF Transcript_4438/g.8460 Transcript_4438/m.8460 type:complete len:214 (+) Transcript_4438:291-932(+)
MKSTTHLFAALAACLSVQGFQPKPVANHVHRTTPTAPLVDEFVSKWTDLEERQRDLERNPDDSQGFDIAKEMIELALKMVRMETIDEWEHAIQAQTKLEKVVDQERELEKASELAHQEAQEADDMIKSFEPRYLSNLDEWELHRQVTASDVAHRVENYVEQRLREARSAENKAKGEEEEAEQHLLQLSTKENELQALLDQLKKATKEKHGLQP